MKTLTKSAHRKIAGVCGGLAEHWNTDPVWVRVAAAILLFMGATTVPVLVGYCVLWWVLPEPDPT